MGFWDWNGNTMLDGINEDPYMSGDWGEEEEQESITIKITRDNEDCYEQGDIMTSKDLIDDYDFATTDSSVVEWLRSISAEEAVKFIADAWGLEYEIVPKVVEEKEERGVLVTTPSGGTYRVIYDSRWFNKKKK